MSNFVSIFIEEHGQAPAFNLFESCEQVAKRDQSSVPLNQLSYVLSIVNNVIEWLVFLIV